MPWSFIVPAAVSLFSANKQAGAARDAAAAANAQQEKALGLQTRMYEEGVTRQQPYADIGLEFTNKLAALQRGGPGASASMLNMDPGYGFRVSEGQKGLERAAAARGGLISGSALKAATRYGQEMGSQEFGNAYNRMAGLASLGPSAAGVMNNLGQNYSTSASNAYGTIGSNTGNALMSAANSRASALQGIGSAYGRSPVSFSSLYGGGGYSGAGQVNPVSGEYMGSLEF
jgi:hypothetical protein